MSEEEIMAEKTEHLMNVVVEMRKKHGKACVDYAQKAFAAESQLQKISFDATSKANFKPKTPVKEIAIEDYTKDFKLFEKHLEGYCRMIDDLKRKTRNTEDVVTQLKRENIVFRAKEPLRADTLLARAKSKAGQ